MNETNTSTDDPFFRVAVWECIVASIGTPANLLVLILAWSLIRRAEKRRHNSKTYNQYYVLSMTLADFLFTSTHAPLYGIMHVWQLDYPVALCRFFYFMTHTSTVGSSLSLLCLNLDKFIAVHKPLHHILIMNKKMALRLLAGTWLISLSWAILLICGPFLDWDSCGHQLKHPTAYYTFAVLFFVLPIVFSFLIAIYVALVTKDRNAHTASSHSKENGQADQSSLYYRHCRRDARRNTTIGRYKSQAKTLTFVFCTTIWSTVTSIPYRLSFILSILEYKNIQLSMFLFGLMAANALGNPFITMFTQRQYRDRLCKFLMRKK